MHSTHYRSLRRSIKTGKPCKTKEVALESTVHVDVEITRLMVTQSGCSIVPSGETRLLFVGFCSVALIPPSENAGQVVWCGVVWCACFVIGRLMEPKRLGIAREGILSLSREVSCDFSF